MTGPYDDIIGLARPESKRQKMSLYDRAAQFSPFAALTGHDAAIRETARLTEAAAEVDFDGTLMLDAEIRSLADRIGTHPTVTARYFVPDVRKAGGAYVEKTGEVVRVDALRQCLIFADGVSVPFSSLAYVLTE